jgi:phosphoribosyl 1,2-cyclic phosphodiesterase
MGESLMESQVFLPAQYSISPVDLIPDHDVDQEVDARAARYARLATLVDIEDIAEMVCARLKDSAQLRYLIEDAIADPHDPERPHVHINDALKMAQDVLVEVVTAVDEQISVLDVVED